MGDRDLTKLTVNLVPKALDALNQAAELTGDTRTDTVNRALQAYAALVEASHAGGNCMLRWEASATGVGQTAVVVLPPGSNAASLGWFARRRARRLGAVLDALREQPAGWFTPDLAKRLDRNAASVHLDLARLEQAGQVRSWWADGPYPRRRLYAAGAPNER